MPASSQLPIVAIVGRPNVGKSTLFNRFAGRRRALVDDHPGVTRDRIAEEVEVEDRRILLVDTAGLEPREHEGLPGAVQALARSALDDADAIIFVVDGKSGLLPEDEVIAKILHRSAKPVLVAVNKIDVPKHAERVMEFQSLGFEHTWGVSAEHGRGAWDALEMLVAFYLAPPRLRVPPADRMARLRHSRAARRFDRCTRCVAPRVLRPRLRPCAPDRRRPGTP